MREEFEDRDDREMGAVIVYSEDGGGQYVNIELFNDEGHSVANFVGDQIDKLVETFEKIKKERAAKLPTNSREPGQGPKPCDYFKPDEECTFHPGHTHCAYEACVPNRTASAR